MIQVVYSTEHWIVPRIVIGVLIVLLLAIIITEGMARVKAGKAFLAKPGKFFIDNADYVKLFGSLILFAGYVFCLEIIGFTVTSIIFVFLFNLLYGGTSKKAIITSIIISVVASLLISILFGVIFNITLPRGLCTLEFVNFGITLY
ncbi:MAG: tripartite tricarboxylate transporter TctB family protein [Coprococcus sp.]